MTSVVVDTSVLVCLLLDEPRSGAVLSSLAKCEWIGVESLRFEIGNALALGLKRKRLTVPEAHEAIVKFGMMNVVFEPIDFAATILLCAAHNIYAYDAYVLTTAQRLGLPLATLDRRMSEVAQAITLEVVEISP